MNNIEKGEKLLPIIALEEIQYDQETVYFGVDADGGVSFIFEIGQPMVYNMPLDSMLAFSDNMLKAINTLPPHCIYRQYDYYWGEQPSARTTDDIQREYMAFHSQREERKHRSFISLTFRQENPESIFKYIFNTKKTNEKLIDEALKARAEFYAFLSKMRHTGSFLRPLNSIEINNLLIGCFLNQQYDTILPNLDKPQLLDACEFFMEENAVRIGERRMRAIGISNLGENSNVLGMGYAVTHAKEFEADKYKQAVYNTHRNLPTGWVYPITLPLPFNHVVVTTIRMEDRDSLSKGLAKERRDLQLVSEIKAKLSWVDDTPNKVAEINAYLENIANGNIRPVSVFQAVFTCLPIEREVEQKKYMEAIKGAFKSSLNTPITEFNLINGLLLYACNVGGDFNLGGLALKTTLGRAIGFLPLETYDKGDSKGMQVISAFGNIVNLDFWEGNKNGNTILFGDSGSGKSVVINEIIRQTAYLNQNNIKIIVLDKGASFQETIELLGGHHVDSSNSKGMQFNLFANFPQNKAGAYCAYTQEDAIKAHFSNELTGEQILDVQQEIKYHYALVVRILNIIFKDEKFQNFEKTLMQKLISKFFEWINETGQYPDFTNFYAYSFLHASRLQDNDPHKMEFTTNVWRKNQIAMERFVKGVNGGIDGDYCELLNSKTPTNLLLGDFLAIDFESAFKEDPETLYKILMTLALDTITYVLDKLPREVAKLIVMDECLDFLLGEREAEYISELFRKIRKRGGAILMATQSADYLNNISQTVRASIKANTENVMLIGYGNRELAYVRESTSFLDLSEEDIHRVTCIDKDTSKGREMFIKKAGTGSFYYRIWLPFWFVVMYDTRADVIAMKRMAKNKYPNIKMRCEAIAKYLMAHANLDDKEQAKRALEEFKTQEL
jgi:hypothetical protein